MWCHGVWLVMRLTLKRKCRLRVPKGQAVSDVRGSSEVCWLRFSVCRLSLLLTVACFTLRSRQLSWHVVSWGLAADETDLEEEVPSESAKRPGSQ